MWANDDDVFEADEDKDDYQALLSDPNLTAEGQALLMSAEEEAQEALAQMEQHHRTLKEARSKQHQVRMSRRYYRTSFRPAESKVSAKGSVTCLRCGGDHRAANCPKPAGQTAASAEMQSAPFICFAEKENSEDLVKKESQPGAFAGIHPTATSNCPDLLIENASGEMSRNLQRMKVAETRLDQSEETVPSHTHFKARGFDQVPT